MSHVYYSLLDTMFNLLLYFWTSRKYVYKEVEIIDYLCRLRRPTDSGFGGLKHRCVPGGPKKQMYSNTVSNRSDQIAYGYDFWYKCEFPSDDFGRTGTSQDSDDVCCGASNCNEHCKSLSAGD